MFPKAFCVLSTNLRFGIGDLHSDPVGCQVNPINFYIPRSPYSIRHSEFSKSEWRAVVSDSKNPWVIIFKQSWLIFKDRRNVLPIPLHPSTSTTLNYYFNCACKSKDQLPNSDNSDGSSKLVFSSTIFKKWPKALFLNVSTTFL